MREIVSRLFSHQIIVDVARAPARTHVRMISRVRRRRRSQIGRL